MNQSMKTEIDRYKKEIKQLEKKYQGAMASQRAATTLDTTARLNSSRSSIAGDALSVASAKSTSSASGGMGGAILKQELRDTKEKLSKAEKKNKCYGVRKK